MVVIDVLYFAAGADVVEDALCNVGPDAQVAEPCAHRPAKIMQRIVSDTAEVV